MILIIDNYDSFTWNLVQSLEILGANVSVKQNDDSSALANLNADGIIISPGPGIPADSGYSNQVIQQFMNRKPILGVCLGHQSIESVFGANIQQSKQILHGKTSLIKHDGLGIFKNIENPVEVVRYHSLAILPESIPEDLEVSATTENGVIMGVRHKKYAIEGIQFHPESIFTKQGKEILKNFLDY